MDRSQLEGQRFRVGELAAATAVTVRTLHYYEEIGLLVPERTEAGHRFYSSEDVERLSRICLLRRMGLPLSAVARSLARDGTDLRAVLENYLEELSVRLQVTTTLRNGIQQFMATTDSSGRTRTDQLFKLLEETAMAPATIERRISVLVYSDLESAFDYLVSVFQLGPGALFRDQSGRVVHGELEVGDGVVWLHPELKSARLASPRSLGGSSSTMAVMVENVDTHFENAVKAGAKIEHAPVDQPYGYREYSAWDCEDQLWSFMKALA